MGSMNSNNWLSFPLSPTHSSLPSQLHPSHSHQFSLGLVNDSMDNPFQNQGKNPPLPFHFHLLFLGFFFLPFSFSLYVAPSHSVLLYINLVNLQSGIWLTPKGAMKFQRWLIFSAWANLKTTQILWPSMIFRPTIRSPITYFPTTA